MNEQNENSATSGKTLSEKFQQASRPFERDSVIKQLSNQLTVELFKSMFPPDQLPIVLEWLKNYNPETEPKIVLPPASPTENAYKDTCEGNFGGQDAISETVKNLDALHAEQIETELDKLARLEAAASPAPWPIEVDSIRWCPENVDLAKGGVNANMEFISAIRSAAKDLIWARKNTQAMCADLDAVHEILGVPFGESAADGVKKLRAQLDATIESVRVLRDSRRKFIKQRNEVQVAFVAECDFTCSLKKQLEALRNERNEAVANVCAERDTLIIQCVDLRDERDKHACEAVAAREQLAGARDAATSLRTTLHATQRELSNYKEYADKVCGERDSFCTRLNEANAELSKLRKEWDRVNVLTAALNRTARERDGARQQLDTFVKEFEPLAAFISQGSVGHPGECVFEVAIERIKLAETKVKNLSASLTEVVDSHNAKVREIERLQGRLADERNRTDAGSTGPGRCLFLENELALVREQRDNARKILAKYEKTATQIVQEQNREASQRNELNLLRMERDGARKELARLGAMLKGMSDSITTR